MLATVTSDINSISEFPGNPRKGNIAQLKESLNHNGQYKPIVIQKSSRKILAGNHLWKAAKELGWETIDVVELDVDDAQAKKIVVADNRLADMGSYDEKALLDLLGEIDLAGTGYEPQDIDDLLAFLEEQQAPEWKVANAEAIHENVQLRPSLEERADRYAERTIRLLMCEYPNHQYIWVIEKLTEMRDKFGVDSNAEAILAVLAEYLGSDYPR